MKDDPLFIHFEALDHLIVALATHGAQGDEVKLKELIGIGWFRLVTEPMYLEICLETIGVRA